MATYPDDKVEGLSGAAIHNPYVTRDGDVAASAFVSFQRGGPAVLKGTGPATGTGVGVVLDTAEAWTGKLVSIRNEGVEKAYFDKDGLLFGPGTMVSSYGGMFVYNESAATVALTVAGTFYPIVASVEVGSVKGAPYVTFASAALTIGASGAGLYLVNCSFSGILSATDTLDLVICKGGTPQNNIRSDQSVTNQTSYASGAMTGILPLVADDVIDVRAACDGGSKTLQMKHMNLTLIRVG